MVQQNNGGLPAQKISGEPARDAAINQRIETNERHLSLIGGKKRRRQIYVRGGGGENNIPSPSPISPPVVPNTGSSSETRGAQQDSYNELAKLSGNVNEQSRYDKVGGRRTRIRRRKKRKSRKYKRTRRTRTKRRRTRRTRKRR